MRTYGKIYTTFWTDERTSRLSDAGVRLATYLLTGPHSNSSGCFRLPLTYVATDLRWGAEKTLAAFAELEGIRFVQRCPRSEWIFIRNYLKHNPPENGKVGRSMAPYISSIPRELPFYAEFVAALAPHAHRFPDGYVASLGNGIQRTQDTVSGLGPSAPQAANAADQGAVQPSPDTVSSKSGTPEPEPEPEPEPSGSADADPARSARVVGPASNEIRQTSSSVTPLKPAPTGVDQDTAQAAAATANAPDPGNLKVRIFGECLTWLSTATGKTRSSLRSLVGRWLKVYGDAVVIEAFMAAQREAPIEPVAWMESALKARGATGLGAGYDPQKPSTWNKNQIAG